MLTIICGDDFVSSRKYFSQIKSEYFKKNIEIKDIVPQELPDVLNWQGDNLSLFASKKIFAVERIESHIVRKRGKKKASQNKHLTLEEIVQKLAQSKNIEVINWEEKPGRELKLKTIAKIKEFKLSNNIFKLLDACYPNNFSVFIRLLSENLDVHEEMFIFTMLCRHIRTLILAQDHIFSPSVQSWQKQKISGQALLWTRDKLIGFYEGLYRIDFSSKSATNPYGTRKSLEILACYYL
ncbi:MAG: hypothetical protein WC489_05805 [Patescibacteria group bacterium]